MLEFLTYMLMCLLGIAGICGIVIGSFYLLNKILD